MAQIVVLQNIEGILENTRPAPLSDGVPQLVRPTIRHADEIMWERRDPHSKLWDMPFYTSDMSLFDGEGVALAPGAETKEAEDSAEASAEALSEDLAKIEPKEDAAAPEEQEAVSDTTDEAEEGTNDMVSAPADNSIRDAAETENTAETEDVFKMEDVADTGVAAEMDAAKEEGAQDQPMARVDEPQIQIETPDADNSQSVSRYVFSVQKKISEAISYPYEAVKNGWAGTVKLTLKILKDGSLEEVTVKESSGHNIFDTDAVNTAEILAPYAAFPPEMELNEITVTIPIVYSQDSASLDVGCQPRPGTGTEARPFLSSGKTYEEVVQEKIAGAITYPEAIRHFGWEGTVRLNLRISRDGTLSYAEVRESSGHKVFDQCALQTAKAVAPFSVFPADSATEELNVIVPIVYSLEK